MTTTQSWWGRLKQGLSRSRDKLTTGLKTLLTHRRLDESMLEELEELLISCDVGLSTSQKLTLSLRQQRYDQDIEIDEVKTLLAQSIAEILTPHTRELMPQGKKPYVVLAVGVNGSGKTTTLGKLAHLFQEQNLSVMMVAGDTFRAAAVEQLQVWGDRLKTPVMTTKANGDAAGLCFEALQEAMNKNIDVVLIDTAGRLHNKTQLMDELEKIVRVMKKIDPSYPHETLLILDATIGQNAYAQVETFQQIIGLSGFVVTKLDGTAKGGVVIGLADQFQLPIYAIGVGEQFTDLRPFHAQSFANNLVGIDDAA